MDNDGFVDLAERLKGLAFPARLALVRFLRTPKLLSQIMIHPVRKDGGLDPKRYVARQTVERHIKTLVELGFVVAEDTPQGKVYRASPESLFLLREDLNQVSAVFQGTNPVGGATLIIGVAKQDRVKGPHLVLVKGAYEGKFFPLKSGNQWIIGRHQDAEVNLEYDPYVSKQHASIVRRLGRYHLRNEGRNGTLIDWRVMEPDEEAPLRAGSTIGVGRSLLTFHPG